MKVQIGNVVVNTEAGYRLRNAIENAMNKALEDAPKEEGGMEEWDNLSSGEKATKVAAIAYKVASLRAHRFLPKSALEYAQEYVSIMRWY